MWGRRRRLHGSTRGEVGSTRLGRHEEGQTLSAALARRTGRPRLGEGICERGGFERVLDPMRIELWARLDGPSEIGAGRGGSRAPKRARSFGARSRAPGWVAQGGQGAPWPACSVGASRTDGDSGARIHVPALQTRTRRSPQNSRTDLFARSVRTNRTSSRRRRAFRPKPCATSSTP